MKLITIITVLSLLNLFSCNHLGAPDFIPANLTIPTGNNLVIGYFGNGTQNYICENNTWTLFEPVAKLYTLDKSEQVGIHYFLPTADANGGRAGWTLTRDVGGDGSTVIGRQVASSNENTSSIAWLLINATSHTSEFGSDNGNLSDVTFILRVNTTGGLANTQSPACTATNAGAFQNVSYSAFYFFYSGGAVATSGVATTQVVNTQTATTQVPQTATTQVPQTATTQVPQTVTTQVASTVSTEVPQTTGPETTNIVQTTQVVVQSTATATTQVPLTGTTQVATSAVATTNVIQTAEIASTNVPATAFTQVATSAVATTQVVGTATTQAVTSGVAPTQIVNSATTQVIATTQIVDTVPTQVVSSVIQTTQVVNTAFTQVVVTSMATTDVNQVATTLVVGGTETQTLGTETQTQTPGTETQTQAPGTQTQTQTPGTQTASTVINPTSPITTNPRTDDNGSSALPISLLLLFIALIYIV